ncbi:AAA family ATPase [Lusitaniella coriacea LEGE 07157]|uniref:histidine kinase n=1 Tax=Lusitaniella coriacea LEGE 07157 TaxID=945747 RepID=A0A8J7JE38_9CYAN|nr:AAA family ATPase [Lusitaniella coriacea]MBE9118140.1 AAA family ATPase [Lusitaniella coriacea LEGE 07157]
MTNPSIVLPGYQLAEQIYDGSRTLVYRGTRNADEKPVIIKFLRNEYPTFSELVQFRNQYTIAKNLDLLGIVKPLALETYRNGYALVMPDEQAVSLQDWRWGRGDGKTGKREEQLPIADFLKMGIQLADILHGLYQNRVIHKDIKPANILIHQSTKQVKLIDFSISSLLPKETQEIQNPNVLEGTLAYLSPEQTGRMNRGVDYRSDFYSLGVTFYELLKGKLPFNSDDPMELVHCHIAKSPISITSQKIPQTLSDIVMKLMAKNVEDRYQNALGLKYDLEKCLKQWQETGTIEEFELGKRDVRDRFIIPEKLYGREAEVAQLLEAFERISQGSSELSEQPLTPSPSPPVSPPSRSELVLVAGYSGVGKTAVVNEVHKPIVKQRGYFIKGKFDQFNRNIPFSAFVQAFRDLMGQLLSESNTQLEQWKATILSALGENGQVIIDVVPELEQIIGQQPAVTELSGSEAQNRFNRLFSKFVRVFTTKEHPLTIFLDDLQWADSASLSLMKLLMGAKESNYLLTIGAYRDNEVFPAHPLMSALEEIEKAGVAVGTITLTPLTPPHLNQLIADTLNCQAGLAQPLTELVYQKTQGNPFFATQFLKALYEDELIRFDLQIGHWQCDIARVKQLALTDDVVEFMSLQLQKLPQTTQNILKLAACIGNQFDLETLAVVSEQGEAEAATALWRALQEGLVLPQSEVYKFYQSQERDPCRDLPTVTRASSISPEDAVPRTKTALPTQSPHYKFLHDRVQQAAYSLIKAEEKQTTHLKIGQLLLENATEAEREEKIFDIVNQLNISTSLIESESERDRLAQLNLLAGHKAKASTAYAAAKNYLEIGINLLSSNCWQDQYSLTLNLYKSVAETAFLNGHFEAMQQWISTIIENSKTLLDRIEVYETLIYARIAQKEPLEGVKIGVQVLNQLGIKLPENPAEEDIQQAIKDTTACLPAQGIESLAQLPQMRDPKTLAAMKISFALAPAAYVSGSPIFLLNALAEIRNSIAYGNAPTSAAAYAHYGIILCGIMNDIESGYQFGKLALELSGKSNNKALNAKIAMIFGSFIWPWKIPWGNTLNLLQSGYTYGLDSGSLELAAFCRSFEAQSAYFMGQELSELASKCSIYTEQVRQIQQELNITLMEQLHQTILNLQGQSDDPCILVGDVANEIELIPQYQETNNPLALYGVYLHKAILCYLFDRYSEALDCIETASNYIGGVTAQVVIPVSYFYNSLIRLAIAATAPEEERKVHLEMVAANQNKIENWKQHAPQNFQHKYDLVEAEKYRMLGEKMKAMEFYDLAISGAKTNKYLQEEALANELTAKFYLDWGKEKIAQAYMIEAYYCYARWGAKAKTDQLESIYPQFLAPILQQQQPQFDPDSTLTWNATQTITRQSSTKASSTLDFTTALKASQAISEEIQLDSLLSTLMQVVIENAGADKGALILLESGDWVVRAMATLKASSEGDCTIHTVLSCPMEESEEIPSTLVRYVSRTRELLVINDVAADKSFAGDSYFIVQSPQSLMCAPIVRQGRVIGILYLENQSAKESFTRDRVEVLNLLCAQAAISLENAQLYQQARQALTDLQTAQLQLVQNEKMATLGNLVAGVAHEINNPLSFIGGNVDAAKDYIADLFEIIQGYQNELPQTSSELEELLEDLDLEFIEEDLPKLIASMSVGVERIRNISTSLRTFSRADSTEKTAFNLHDGIDSTILILKYRLKANEQRPEIEILKDYGELPEVQCFPGQLNQVFMNLLANAIDAFEEFNIGRSYAEIEANSNQIIIRTEPIEGDSGVIIRIADNGKGMSEEVQKKVFEHLFTTKGVGKGTGLGLSISRQIVEEKHEGKLICTSQLSKGTEFAIYLPL